MAVSCGRGNKPLDCVKGVEFLDQLSVLLASQVELLTPWS